MRKNVLRLALRPHRELKGRMLEQADLPFDYVNRRE